MSSVPLVLRAPARLRQLLRARRAERTAPAPRPVDPGPVPQRRGLARVASDVSPSVRGGLHHFLW